MGSTQSGNDQAELQEPTKPKGGLRAYAIIAIAVIVILAIILATVQLVFLSPQSSPQATLQSAVNAINDRNAQGLVDCCQLRFANETRYGQFLTSMEHLMDYWEEQDFTIGVSNINVTYKSSMTQFEIDDASAMIEDGITATVDSLCMLHFKMSISSTNASPQSFSTYRIIYMEQINGNWYLLDSYSFF